MICGEGHAAGRSGIADESSTKINIAKPMR
jgi:hypothetical protein